MGIFFIGIILVIGAFVLNRWYNNKRKSYSELSFGVFLTSFLIGAVLIICSIVPLICTTINDRPLTETLTEQKQLIECRLEKQESEDGLVVNGGLYNDIKEYNATIRNYHYYGKSFWFNWFYEDGPCELELIELPDETP